MNARNLDQNLKNMTETERVSKLDHYIWWFSANKRSSYIVRNNGRPEIIFWHQVRSVNRQQYLIGGWFVCTANVSGASAFFALNAQLKMTDAAYPRVPWVAVIHKTNKFVKQLNIRHQFRNVSDVDSWSSVAQALFPSFSDNIFDIYTRN